MTDREKIIRAVKTCFDSWIDKHRNMGLDLQAVEQIKYDALELLKEQEPLKPVNVRWEMGIRGGTCLKCLNWVQRSYNYCPFCGRKVKWDD